MMLVATTKPSELPTEALLVRLRARRAAIDLGGDKEIAPTQGGVVAWVYRRLNSHLRKRLAPFLDILAMRNLVLALRYVLAGEDPSPSLRDYPPLAAPLQALLVSTTDPESTVARLEALLATDYPFSAGLAMTYRNQGPGGLEQQLTGGILCHSLHQSGRNVVRMTIQYLVDMRNCLIIKKFWRWQVSQPPAFTAGGTLSRARLHRLWRSQNEDELAAVIRRISGEADHTFNVVNVEKRLLTGLSRQLRRAGRDPLGLAVIIDYLWRSQLATHNQLLRRLLTTEQEELLSEALLL